MIKIIDPEGRVHNLAWLLFVIARGIELSNINIVRLLRRTKNLAELAFMLAAVMTTILKHLPQNIHCELLDCKVRH